MTKMLLVAAVLFTAVVLAVILNKRMAIQEASLLVTDTAVGWTVVLLVAVIFIKAIKRWELRVG